MPLNETILVATFGIKDSERRVMQTICMASKGRQRAYELLSTDASKAPDIIIADADNPRAMAAWKRFQTSYPTVPGIMIARKPAVEGSDFQVGRPIKATSLLKVLDRLSRVREHPARAHTDSEETAKETSTSRGQVA